MTETQYADLRSKLDRIIYLLERQSSEPVMPLKDYFEPGRIWWGPPPFYAPPPKHVPLPVAYGMEAYGKDPST